MTAHDRRRVRRLVDAPDGARLALELPTGTVLQPGQVLHRIGGRARMSCRRRSKRCWLSGRATLEEAARIGHLIGNLHRDIETRTARSSRWRIRALADRLRRAGVPFAAERRPFHGRAPGEHAH